VTIERPPSAGDTNYKNWAERLNDWLTRTRSRLVFFATGDSAKEDGILLWNRQNKYPVVSKDNVYTRVVLADGGNHIKVPTSATEPTSPEEGMMFYDSSVDKLKVYANGAWVSLN
tara:strand:+ start:2744 stop:3088 length:345 start_codon:yes stop_codon:yes gene_type:complete